MVGNPERDRAQLVQWRDEMVTQLRALGGDGRGEEADILKRQIDRVNGQIARASAEPAMAGGRVR